MADGNTKLVEDVVAGDFIWNPVKKAPRKVLQIVEGPEKRPLITVRTAQNTLSMSQEHPVRVVDQTSQPLLRVALNSPRSDKSDSSWKIQQAKDLRVGSIIQLASGDPAEITSVEQTPAEEGLYVINFVLEGNPDDVTERMLVADGIVTGDLVLQQRLAKGNLANKHD